MQGGVWSLAPLLDRLAEDRAIERKDGCEYIEKRIPDAPGDRGKLDPRVRRILQEQEASAEGGVPSDDAVVSWSLSLRARMGWKNADVTTSPMSKETRTIEGTNGPVKLRVYAPLSGRDKRPVIVFFHGGGFIGGSLDVVENPCLALADKAGAVVVSVDYRLAPEHPYPAGITDCFDAVRWTFRNAAELGADPERLCVAGDSAGGNMATVCALMDRDLGTGMIKRQALIYPSVNLARAPTGDPHWNIEAYGIAADEELIRPELLGMMQQLKPLSVAYLQGRAEATDPRVSPLLGDLRGMPDTLIVTAEFDGLRLEGEAYARKLALSGANVRLIRYNGTDHAFMDKFGLYPQAEDCLTEIARWLTETASAI